MSIIIALLSYFFSPRLPRLKRQDLQRSWLRLVAQDRFDPYAPGPLWDSWRKI